MKRRQALGAPPGRFATAAQKRAVLERDGWQCTYCHRLLEWPDAAVDHVVPYKLGGPTTLENLVAACLRCNKAKGNLSEAEFRALLEGPVNPGV